MTFFIFAGDMLVMAFMMGVAVWVYMKSSRESIEAASRIPLEDEAEPMPADEVSDG
ncbi:MAG: cbb3-type cytochrome c oxidase subunit 3 [Xanthomonadales bacterium]|nr:cbb3-type cytochrome c oxidase subunit 3 [Xanthomonadales bacterium]